MPNADQENLLLHQSKMQTAACDAFACTHTTSDIAWWLSHL
jgi:hypothetical protein